MSFETEDGDGRFRLPGIPQRIAHGVDELNLAEFPICAFSSNPTQRNGDVQVFEDTVPDPMHPGKTVTRRLEIIPTSKDDPLGPLTPDDDWVLLGLLQLAKLQDFPKQLRFTRYQLLKLLGWQTNARDYSKVQDSLLRLKAYNFRFYNGFFDAKAKSFATVAFNLFNDVLIYEQENSLTRPKPNPHQDAFHFACSYLVWSDRIHDQFMNRGVKGINFDFAKSLKRPLTRRLFRFLDKNFYFKNELSYDLESFATAHCGLTARQEFRDLKKTLCPALAELEALRFIEPVPEDERFLKLRRTDDEMESAVGERRLRRFKYIIIFRKGNLDANQRERAQDDPILSDIQKRITPLVKRGVSEDQAVKLVKGYPDTIILHQVDVVDWMEEQGLQFKTSKGAYLRDRIVNHKDRPDPQGFVTRAQRQAIEDARRKKVEDARQAKVASENAANQRNEEVQKRFVEWWESRGKEGQTEVNETILAGENNEFETRYLKEGEDTSSGRAIWMAKRKKVFSERTGIPLPPNY